MILTRTKDMTSGNPVKLILVFALPILAGNILQQLYSLVDSLIIGRILGVTALTAVRLPAGWTGLFSLSPWDWHRAIRFMQRSATEGKGFRI